MIRKIRTNTTIYGIQDHVAVNSGNFTQNINFVTLSATGAVAPLSAAGKIYGITDCYSTIFTATNETVELKKVSVEYDLQNMVFEIDHTVALTQANIGDYADLASSSTITLAGTPKQFRIIDVLPDTTGALKKIQFVIAYPETLQI